MAEASEIERYVRPGDSALISGSRLMPGRLFNGLLAYFLRDARLYGAFSTANSPWDQAPRRESRIGPSRPPASLPSFMASMPPTAAGATACSRSTERRAICCSRAAGSGAATTPQARAASR